MLTRSGLVYRERAADKGHAGPPIVAIGTDMDQMYEFASQVSRSRIVTPEGYFGVYEGAMTLKSRGWYYEAPDIPYPEPASFGHSLIEVEQLIYDLHDRLQSDERPPVMLGHGQGACIALWLAQIIPDYLSGVISLGGMFREIPGCAPSAVDSSGLPILLLWNPLNRDAIEESAARLRERGIATMVCEGSSPTMLDTSTADLVRGWLEMAVPGNEARSHGR